RITKAAAAPKKKATAKEIKTERDARALINAHNEFMAQGMAALVDKQQHVLRLLAAGRNEQPLEL
ncbi:hypothetical protein OC834_005788, partial [Tilletia horrida]